MASQINHPSKEIVQTAVNGWHAFTRALFLSGLAVAIVTALVIFILTR